MIIPLYRKIAKSEEEIRKSTSLKENMISIQGSPALLSRGGDFIFEGRPMHSFCDTAEMLARFFHSAEEACQTVKGKKMSLSKVLTEANSVGKYVVDGRGQYIETCKKAEEVLEDLAELIRQLKRLGEIREMRLESLMKDEGRHVLSEIFNGIAPIAEKYQGTGIPVGPKAIRIEIEIMDI